MVARLLILMQSLMDFHILEERISRKRRKVVGGRGGEEGFCEGLTGHATPGLETQNSLGLGLGLGLGLDQIGLGLSLPKMLPYQNHSFA